METLVQDLRQGLRSLVRSPSFTLTALTALALGVAATTTMYSVARGIALRPLPFPEPDALVSLAESTPDGRAALMSAATFDALAGQSGVFADAALHHGVNFVLAGPSAPVFVPGARVTPSFFRLLGIRPALGRDFSASDGTPGQPPTALLADGFWRRQFGADPNIAGRTIRLDGAHVTILGVLPLAFQLGGADVYVAGPEGDPAPPTARVWAAIGRLHDGVTAERARIALDLVASRLAAARPETNRGWTFRMRPLQEAWLGVYRQQVLLLLAAVGLLLLISGTNIANLLLQRAVARQREMAIRASLGAGSLRLFRQLMTESLALGMTAGLIGLLVARWTLGSIVGIIPANTLAQLPGGAAAIRIDWHVVTVVLAVSLAVAVLFGVAPAWRLARTRASVCVTARGAAAGSHGRAWRRVLVVSQVTMTAVLLTTASLVLRSLSAATSMDRGYEPDGVITAYISLPPSRYPEPAVRVVFFDSLIDRVRALPGVASAAGSVLVSGRGRPYAIEGQSTVSTDAASTAVVRIATPDYFSTLGIPMIRGRGFGREDRFGGPGVAVVNQTLARRAWPNGDPVGRRLRFPDQPDADEWLTVVGVAGDVRESLDPRFPYQLEPRPLIYLAAAQRPGQAISVFVRTSVEPISIVPMVRKELAGLDSEIPAANVTTVREAIGVTLATPRLHAWLLSAFALVALVLAAVGVYGLIAYSVSQRLPEIGVRLALGAAPRQIRRAVVVDALKLAVIGVAVGTVGSLGAGRLFAAQLYGVDATDPVSLIAVACSLMVVAAAAGYVPARRAARVDPVAALRAE